MRRFCGCWGSKGDKYAALIEAKKLADKLGGVERAREAVAKLLLGQAMHSRLAK